MSIPAGVIGLPSLAGSSALVLGADDEMWLNEIARRGTINSPVKSANLIRLDFIEFDQSRSVLETLKAGREYTSNWKQFKF
jgi:hypothetical protein